MSTHTPSTLFSKFGVELEYMIVDAESLDVRPISDELLAAAAGEITGEFEHGAITWSNELVAHVIELKVTEPALALDDLPQAFQTDVRKIDALLAPQGARLMPGGMHPWMDPLRETKLWAHEYNEVYEAFDRIFGCRGHGWSNLQAVHLNLPFEGDDEFGRLHAAIRLVLPILPALTASSPMIDGRLSGVLDNRLEAYRGNSRKIPSIAGRVIPEPVFTRGDYERQIFERIFADIAPHDPKGVLRHEWLNARGAIARFTRNTIEIRVMDVQECPEADVALCAVVVALLESLTEGRFGTFAQQQAFAVDRLEPTLLATIRDGDRAAIADREYLSLFGQSDANMSAGDLWRFLIGTLAKEGWLDARWMCTLETYVRRGPLARRIVDALGAARCEPSDRGPLRNTYRELCDCLEKGAHFGASTHGRE